MMKATMLMPLTIAGADENDYNDGDDDDDDYDDCD